MKFTCYLPLMYKNLPQLSQLFKKSSFIFFILLCFCKGEKLEAQGIDLLFDHKTSQEVSLENSFDCFELTIENLGEGVIKNVFPYVNKNFYLSPEQLIEKLAQEKYPLVTLFQFWSQSVLIDDQLEMNEEHPLNVINFKGHCSSQSFVEDYIKLCHLLGFNLRLANIKNCFLLDFACQDNEWQLFDLDFQQFYLDWDNETLLSSEELMDDPLLVLRTKRDRTQEIVDMQKNFEHLAQFDILYPQQATPLLLDTLEWIDHMKGFTLYPKEKLVFQAPLPFEALPHYKRQAHHTVHLDQRKVAASPYVSPFPIESIKNEGQESVYLTHQKITLQPGETFFFSETNLFHLYFKFEEKTNSQLTINSTFAWSLFPHFKKGKQTLYLGCERNNTLIHLFCKGQEEKKSLPPQIKIMNESSVFDFCSPEFYLNALEQEPEKIWWQISPESSFNFIPSNFDCPQNWAPVITLPLLSETFLNPDQLYYFRVKSYQNKQWSEWSAPFEFKVQKPEAVREVNFEKIKENQYELNWERYENLQEELTYLVFGSNALDFIPSIYEKNQINALAQGKVTESELVDNLIAVTKEAKLVVNGQLAYYRLIAEKKGKYSNPSPLIHIYDDQLAHPRHVLQTVEGEVKRQLIPSSDPWNPLALPLIKMPPPTFEQEILKAKELVTSLNLNQFLELTLPYDINPSLSKEIWETVRPFLLPENHPIRPKMDRIFKKSRVTQTPETFKKAGFKRYRPGHWSRVMASSHPELQGYFIKAFADTELRIKNDWLKWVHRIQGAESIRACIHRHHYRSLMKVPRKWIYPLPLHPSVSQNSHYLKKNFILVAENMRIEEHSKNEKMYRKNVTPKLMDALYTVFQEEGLFDSVYPFNVPFCKDGKLAFIDTEFHHKWPVPFHKLTSHFSKEWRQYWTNLTQNGGKIAQPEPNRPHPPRQD